MVSRQIVQLLKQAIHVQVFDGLAVMIHVAQRGTRGNVRHTGTRDKPPPRIARNPRTAMRRGSPEDQP
jgi:hypothetical protein